MNSPGDMRNDRAIDESTILTANNVSASGLVDTSTLAAGSINVVETSNDRTDNGTSPSRPSV